MGRHEAPDDAEPSPVVAAALAHRPDRGAAHSADEPRRGPLGWPGPERPAPRLRHGAGGVGRRVGDLVGGLVRGLVGGLVPAHHFSPA